jgi:hypothetical protein
MGAGAGGGLRVAASSSLGSSSQMYCKSQSHKFRFKASLIINAKVKLSLGALVTRNRVYRKTYNVSYRRVAHTGEQRTFAKTLLEYILCTTI